MIRIAILLLTHYCFSPKVMGFGQKQSYWFYILHNTKQRSHMCPISNSLLLFLFKYDDEKVDFFFVFSPEITFFFLSFLGTKQGVIFTVLAAFFVSWVIFVTLIQHWIKTFCEKKVPKLSYHHSTHVLINKSFFHLIFHNKPPQVSEMNMN